VPFGSCRPGRTNRRYLEDPSHVIGRLGVNLSQPATFIADVAIVRRKSESHGPLRVAMRQGSLIELQ